MRGSKTVYNPGRNKTKMVFDSTLYSWCLVVDKDINNFEEKHH